MTRRTSTTVWVGGQAGWHVVVQGLMGMFRVPVDVEHVGLRRARVRFLAPSYRHQLGDVDHVPLVALCRLRGGEWENLEEDPCSS